jgi:hypothetical protein
MFPCVPQFAGWTDTSHWCTAPARHRAQRAPSLTGPGNLPARTSAYRCDRPMPVSAITASSRSNASLLATVDWSWARSILRAATRVLRASDSGVVVIGIVVLKWIMSTILLVRLGPWQCAYCWRKDEPAARAHKHQHISTVLHRYTHGRRDPPISGVVVGAQRMSRQATAPALACAQWRQKTGLVLRARNGA